MHAHGSARIASQGTAKSPGAHMHGDARATAPQRPPSLRRQPPRILSLPAGVAAPLCAAIVMWTMLAPASAARGQTAHLRARVGEAFYLPIAVARDQSARVLSMQAAVSVEPAGILRAEYASGPRRCCAKLGVRGVAMMCDGTRSIRGPLVQMVYAAIAAGVATVTLSDCRVGEAMVPCPAPVEIEVRR